MNLSYGATHVMVIASLSLLAVCSTLTWILIVHKIWIFHRLTCADRRYSANFLGNVERNLASAFRASEESSNGPKARLAHAGLVALSSIATGNSKPTSALGAWDRHERLERFLSQQIHRERRSLEPGLTWLASVASIAPFLGLFGTVFGIIDALRAVGTGNAVGIASIAGPVGQALVATGIGIAVAIPAVAGYNLLLRKLRVIVADLEDHAADLLNLAQSHGYIITAFDGPLSPADTLNHIVQEVAA
jgi:biopolymer transport protein ExbB